mmetsp:Transcript_114853/g.246824  ORF Transcript_114853/g.246824 Transcript_114853/m.246824 type:complete len:317 (-) Transcript_114853:381-1331(-)
MVMPRGRRIAAGATAGTAFRKEAAALWTIPVKNTFINFDVPHQALEGSRARATSCPASPNSSPSHEAAIKELCHAMAPRAKGMEPIGRAGRRTQRASGAKQGAGAGAEVDCISEVSTGVSDHETRASTTGRTASSGSLMPMSPKPTQWKDVPGRKKGKMLVANQSMYHAAPSDASPAFAAPTPKAKGQQTAQAGSREEAPPQARRNDAKGKGLSNFTRVEVGIADDRDFRVVQRLIGPKGRHMSDIVAEAKGAKVWIIGRGSRSWEDDEGPLMVCVGAMSSSVFAAAVGLVQELLVKVHREHSKFQPRHENPRLQR